MINSRDIRKIQNDMKWVISKIEEFSKWRQQYDARHTSTDSGADESNLETTSQPGEETKKSVEGYKQSSTADEKGIEKTSSDRPKD